MSESHPPELQRPMRRALLREASLSAGPLVAITIGFALVPLRGTVARPVVLAVLVVVTAAAAGLGGVTAGATTAVAAALVVDFSHTAPYDLLVPSSLLRTLALFVLVAALVGGRGALEQHVRR